MQHNICPHRHRTLFCMCFAVASFFTDDDVQKQLQWETIETQFTDTVSLMHWACFQSSYPGEQIYQIVRITYGASDFVTFFSVNYETSCGGGELWARRRRRLYVPQSFCSANANKTTVKIKFYTRNANIKIVCLHIPNNSSRIPSIST